jgi:hypothetical protein
MFGWSSCSFRPGSAARTETRPIGYVSPAMLETTGHVEYIANAERDPASIRRLERACSVKLRLLLRFGSVDSVDTPLSQRRNTP